MCAEQPWSTNNYRATDIIAATPQSAQQRQISSTGARHDRLSRGSESIFPLAVLYLAWPRRCSVSTPFSSFLPLQHCLSEAQKFKPYLSRNWTSDVIVKECFRQMDVSKRSITSPECLFWSSLSLVFSCLGDTRRTWDFSLSKTPQLVNFSFDKCHH